MKNRDNIRQTETKVNPLTSLNQKEYALLLRVFEPLVSKKLRYYTLQSTPRCHKSYRERSNSSLSGSARKLDFILMYMKENPNQAYQGHCFGISQGKVSQWVRFLAPVLVEALAQMKVMPQRGDCFKSKERQPESDYLALDVIERAVTRSTDYATQQEFYSGKHKKHTVKNLAVSTAQGYVLFLSDSYEGKKHDKAIFDELHITETEEDLLADLGFWGADKTQANIVLPFKKPIGAELRQNLKIINQFIARARVIVEHAFAGIKRLKIIRNKIRLKGWSIKDQMMDIATALHNLRVLNRQIKPIQNQT